MRTPRSILAAAGLSLAASAPAVAQSRFVVADRTNDVLWTIHDANGNGVIDEPDEVFLYFSAANAAGTIGILNPTALAIRPDGLAIMGDQLHRNIFVFQDLNGDGDAQDEGESIVAADADNASGVSFAFPTGAAFDSKGRAYIVNAGNAFGDDGIYRLVDLNGDGDFQDPGEITDYVTTGGFGPGNGPFSPQEIVFDSGDVGYLRNSSANLHGVYRFEDKDGNGRADDAGEFTVFWDAGNASGVPALAGFPLELDAVRPGCMYTMQIASGGVDQLVRLCDLNGDGDAQDLGEAAIVWETGESGFTAVDVASLADGRVLVADNSANRVILLEDLDGDGRFDGPGERTDYFANASGVFGAARQIAIFPVVDAKPCPPDWDGDGELSATDFFAYLSDFFLGDADFDGSGETTAEDFFAFLTAFFEGC